MIGTATRRDKGYLKQRSVWFNSSAELRQGVGVFYEIRYGTMTNQDLRRGYYTVPASVGSSSELYFAGVAAQDYSATTGGQEIVINEPGSVCLIRTEGNVVDLEVVATQFSVTNPGWFTAPSTYSRYPLVGAAAAQVHQTDATVSTSTGRLVVAKLFEGDISMPWYKVLGSSYAAGGSLQAVFGNHGLNFVILDAQPSNDLTYTLGQATEVGMRVAFGMSAAMTNDLVVTLSTAGVQLDGSTALNTLELDAEGDYSMLEFVGPHWKLIANSGTGLA